MAGVWRPRRAGQELERARLLDVDSLEYDVLSRACGNIAGLDSSAMTCEIGLREGGGTRHIIDALLASGQQRVHVAVDPYGDIDYQISEKQRGHVDYTNKMRNRCLRNLYAYLAERNDCVDVLVFILEDTEFFQRYADGVPVYRRAKQLLTRYALVHFDGPHALAPLLGEVEFFAPRLVPGGYFVFDDIQGYYDHDAVEGWLSSRGFELREKGFRKASYQLTG